MRICQRFFTNIFKSGTTKALNFIQHHPTVPAYQVMNVDGSVHKDLEHVPKQWKADELNYLLKLMIEIECFDKLILETQGQGRISFYMPNLGEYATQLGTVTALKMEDIVYCQYRELGVFIHRGFGFQDAADQCFSNHNDPGKGRQMPVHYGSKTLNLITVSSPLATQIPQASGCGYGLRVSGQNRIAVVFFGDGAASEGDFHTAMNFAATLKSQTLFICRNNGYAISTHVDDQYAGDGIVARGPGYGMPSVRVDGNDMFAVHEAIKKARQIVLETKAPALVECLTYRVGSHSTSDNADLYRNPNDVTYWVQQNSPYYRLERYLKKIGKLEVDVETLKTEGMKKMREIRDIAEKKPKPPVSDTLQDVYDKLPWNLERQQDYMWKHLEKWSDKYPLSKYADFWYEE